MKKMKKSLSFRILGLVIIGLMLMAFLNSCANKTVVDACLIGEPYGFWNGLWHGIIAPVDLVGMIFRADVSVYAENNNGAWYAFGFLIGSGGWGFLGAKGGRKRKCED